MNGSVLDLYEQVAGEVRQLPAFGEMLFYTGSPDAEILVVSEAPTLPNDPGDHTLYHSVTEERAGQSEAELAAFLEGYPFQEEGRNDLFEQYVDRILEVCDQPEREIGFTDLCKQPLAAFDEEVELGDVWNRSPYSSGAAIIEQIRAVNPSIVVCNKKNVSQLLSGLMLGGDAYTGGWPTSTHQYVPDEDLTLVYSTMAHMQMSLLSRKRLAEEIAELYTGC